MTTAGRATDGDISGAPGLRVSSRDAPAAPVPAHTPTRASRRRSRRDPSTHLLSLVRRYGDAVRFDTDHVLLASAAATKEVLAREGRDFVADGLTAADPRVDPAVRREWITARQLVQRQLARPDARTAPTPDLLAEQTRLLATSDESLAVACQALTSTVVVTTLLPAAPESLRASVVTSSTNHIRLLQATPRHAAALARQLRRDNEALQHDVAGYVASPASAESPLVESLRTQLGAAAAVKGLAAVIAGAHTIPGAAAAWLCALLSRHPDVRARLRDDTDDTITFAAHVARETLRLFPPAWLLVRQAATDAEVDGWRLAAGDLVHVSPYLVHRDHRHWTAPDAFDPDRWRAARGPYLPFGNGPRICPASGFAEQYLAGLARAISSYDLTVEGLRASFGPVLTPVTGRWRMVTPRGS